MERAQPVSALALGVMFLIVGSLLISGTRGASNCDDKESAFQLDACVPAMRKDPRRPSHNCCFVIQNIALDCLCSCLLNPLGKPMEIDLQAGLQLPRQCKRAVPPGTTCGGFAVPGYAAQSR